ncbi:MAG: hypothetical protein JWR80_3689 [Bradyrhizobium sp.]|nr:hypothetical protein [Bradyrhizobium sp.]
MSVINGERSLIPRGISLFGRLGNLTRKYRKDWAFGRLNIVNPA